MSFFSDKNYLDRAISRLHEKTEREKAEHNAPIKKREVAKKMTPYEKRKARQAEKDNSQMSY